MATTTSTVSRPAPVRKSERTSMLARLLASENITVLHDAGAQTAHFNLKERTLVLPCWQTGNPSVYDFLVGHEVGHAKHTPAGEWLAGCISIGGTSPRAQMIAKDYLNVVEDARIERAIKREFPGLRRDFVEGYRVLHREMNIFKAKGRDLSDLPLIDRLNLHFKIGVHCGEVIPFTAEETKWVDAVAACRTWEDVVEVSRDLFNLAKQQREEQAQDGDESQQGEQSEDGDESQDGNGERGESQDGKSERDESQDGERGESQDGEGAESEDGDDGDDVEGEQTEDGNADGESGDTESKDATDAQDKSESSEGNTMTETSTDGDVDLDNLLPAASETVRQFEEGMGMFAQTDYTEQTLRVEDMDLSKIFISADQFVEWARKVGHNWSDEYLPADIGSVVDAEAARLFKSVSKDNLRAVDLMVKRFEQRRAALNFARQSSHKTGRISTRHLSKYKFSEDIFDRIVVQPDQQNHGIVILLDWSGSMGGIIYQTAKQMLALIQFCRRVGIPAKVTVFTTATSPWAVEKFGEKGWDEMCASGGGERDQSLDFTDDIFGLPSGTTKKGNHVTLMPFGLMDIYDSRMDNRSFAKVMGYFLLTAALNGDRGDLSDGLHHLRANRNLRLGYTPLDESILASRSIVNEFRKNGNQKVTLIAMTDGEGNGLDWAHRTTEAPSPTSRRHARVIIDGLTGRRFDYGNTDHCGSTTETAVAMFKDATGCDFVSISLLDTGLRGGISTLCRAIGDTYEIDKSVPSYQRGQTIIDDLEKKFNAEGLVMLDGNSTKWFFVKVETKFSRTTREEIVTKRRLDRMKNRTVAETRAFIAAQKKEATNRNFINALMDCVS